MTDKNGIAVARHDVGVVI